MGQAQKSCRFCGSGLDKPFLDLGTTPLANSYLKSDLVNGDEPKFPLRVFLCDKCLLVQLADYSAADHIFSDEYAYFSSFTESWVRHAKRYAEMMESRFGISKGHFVVEIASNDGYLLQHFKEKGVPVLGIEPAGNCAAAAEKKGIPSLVKFFGTETARELASQGRFADLLLGNNVLAHVPDLNDFVAGMKILLKPHGIITMEFPHLLRLLEENQFDTIYHEHFSYFSFTVAERIFAAHGITLFDVEELTTHGGSLRIFGRHAENASLAVTPNVERLKAREDDAGLNRATTYYAFADRVQETRDGLLKFLRNAKSKNQRVVGYGAPAKGNTLLNFCGVDRELMTYTVDISPHKQMMFLPGSHIPVYAPDKIRETRPDYVLILPWNIKEEVTRQMSYIRDWGGKFAVPIPEVAVLD